LTEKDATDAVNHLIDVELENIAEAEVYQKLGE
jgi:hypothetical protein